MESVQREILAVLLGRIFELGLLSEATYQSARNSVASMIDLPELLWYPVRLTEEAVLDGSTQNPG